MLASISRNLGGVACAALVLAGCALDRAPIVPGATDGGSQPDARVDASSECPATGCDDGNPCTDDRCVAGTGCVFEPNTASCDDGVLCNGADTCVDRACVHDMIDPCPGASRCNPVANACEGCMSDGDCPGETRIPSGTCTAADTCATSGSEDVTVTSYACDPSGTCVASMRTESQACTRSTEGLSCGAASMEPGDCSYASACAESGSRTITTRTPVCMGGTCQVMVSIISDSAGCTRSTAGAACGAAVVTPGACSYPSTCAESGTRTDTMTTPVCSAGACTGSMTSTSAMTCMRTTGGMVCGACAPVGECTYITPNSCSGPAEQGSLCPTCGGGSCPGTATTVVRAPCTPPATSASCIRSATCSPCVRADGTCPAGRMGTQSCTATFGTCNSSSVCSGNAGTSAFTTSCSCP